MGSLSSTTFLLHLLSVFFYFFNFLLSWTTRLETFLLSCAMPLMIHVVVAVVVLFLFSLPLFMVDVFLFFVFVCLFVFFFT